MVKCSVCNEEFDDTNEKYPKFPHTTCSLECARKLETLEKPPKDL